MSTPLEGERTMMRIFLGESDKAQQGKFHGKPLWEALLADFREAGLAGATVTRAIAGFGANARQRTMMSEYLSLDLPIVVEVVDTEENIQRILPDLNQMMGAGLVTLEKVHVIIYRAS
jgi:PII-like signaling protein